MPVKEGIGNGVVVEAFVSQARRLRVHAEQCML